MSNSISESATDVVWAYSSDLRERLVAYVKAGHTRREAADVFGVSYDSARKWVRWAAEGRSLKSKKPSGPEPTLSNTETEQLAEWVRDKPDRTLEEYKVLISKHIGKSLCISAIDVQLRKLGFTYKKSPGMRPSRIAQT